MAWITPTVKTLLTQITGGELQAFRTAALAEDESQPDPIPQTISDTVNEVRGHIATCAKNKLGPAGTIPDQLVTAFIDTVRYRLITRFPDTGLDSDARTKAYENAVRLFERVADCKYSVEAPEATGPEKMPSNAGATIVKKTRLRFTRDQTDRL